MRRRHTGKAFTLLEIMIIIAILGILAAIAVPAFQKYLRRSKTMEAVHAVRRMFDSSVSYYADEHSDRNGLIVPKQFPKTTGPTPSASCCTYPAAKCPADSVPFEEDDTWTAINFIVSDPHHYLYTYESAGADATAQFSARANGDLNCNNIWSTFERVGDIQNGEYVNGSALYKNLPVE